MSTGDRICPICGGWLANHIDQKPCGAQQGWECPKCGRINSPKEPYCWCSEFMSVHISPLAEARSDWDKLRDILTPMVKAKGLTEEDSDRILRMIRKELAKENGDERYIQGHNEGLETGYSI